MQTRPDELSQSNAVAGNSTSFKRIAPWARIGLAATFGYLVIFLLHHESKDNGGHLGDFRTFYQAAQFARMHKDIYLAGPNSSQMYVYPPMIAFVYTPFTALSMLQAAHVSLVLNALILLGSILLASRIMLERLEASQPGAVWVVALLVTVLSENEIRAVLMMLETDALMLLMFTLALWWLDRRPALAGLALAFALNIKYLSIVALPWLILRRRWAAAGGMILGTVFFALFPAVLIGWHEDLRCLRVSLGGLLRWVGVPPEIAHAIKVHNIADDLSVSVTSSLARLLGPRGFSNPRIMLVAGATGLLALLIVLVLYRAHGLPLFRWPAAARQERQPFKALIAMEWAGLIVVALAFSPDTNVRHLVLTVIVNALAATLLLAPRAVSRKPVVIAVVLIFIAYIMPLGQKAGPLHWFYFNCSIPGWSLLIGYLLILWASLEYVAGYSPIQQSDIRPDNPSAGQGWFAKYA